MKDYEIINKLNNILSRIDSIQYSGHCDSKTYDNTQEITDYVVAIKLEILKRMGDD